MSAELIKKAAELARAAPLQWREFVKALEEYSAEKARGCVASPLERLQTMQGHAQQVAALVTLFKDAVASADRIATSRAVSGAAVQRRHI
jgi:hypothetical protein